MEVIKTEIEGVVIIEPRVFGDARGYFFESFNAREFAEKTGKATRIVEMPRTQQQSPSARVYRLDGTPAEQTVWMSTYGKYVSVELTEDNHRQFFMSKGFAHGFSVLSDEVIFQYKCDEFYAPQSEGAIAWNDPDLAIDWQIPADKVLLSDKDKKHPFLRDFKSPFKI